MKKKLNLNDLRVESFDTLPEISDLSVAHGAAKETDPSGCYYLCNTGCDTVVCCYPTQGNGTEAKEEPPSDL